MASFRFPGAQPLAPPSPDQADEKDAEDEEQREQNAQGEQRVRVDEILQGGDPARGADVVEVVS